MITTDGTDSTGIKPLEGFKHNSLKSAGYAYLVGDSALSVARLMEGDPTGAAGGALWAAGSIACAKYGNPKADKQLELLSHKLGEYLRKQGVAIPDSADTKMLTEEGGIVEHVESFLYKYPSQMLNAVYGIGGAFVAHGGFRKNVKSDIACGALIIAGALAGILIPEKSPDPEHPPQGALQKAWAWMQEKPLRVSSAFYHANNVFTVLGAFEKKRAYPMGNSHYFRFLTAASFIFGNTMLSMSSKGHGGSGYDTQTIQHLAQTCAQVVAAQPQPLQEALVQTIAGYLSSQPEVHLKAAEVALMLNEKLAQRTVRAANVAQWQQRVSNPSPLATPSV